MAISYFNHRVNQNLLVQRGRPTIASFLVMLKLAQRPFISIAIAAIVNCPYHDGSQSRGIIVGNFAV